MYSLEAEFVEGYDVSEFHPRPSPDHHGLVTPGDNNNHDQLISGGYSPAHNMTSLPLSWVSQHYTTSCGSTPPLHPSPPLQHQKQTTQSNEEGRIMLFAWNKSQLRYLQMMTILGRRGPRSLVTRLLSWSESLSSATICLVWEDMRLQCRWTSLRDRYDQIRLYFTIHISIARSKSGSRTGGWSGREPRAEEWLLSDISSRFSEDDILCSYPRCS